MHRYQCPIHNGTLKSFVSPDKGFKGTVVTRELPSLHEGSLEITLPLPLKGVLIENKMSFSPI